MSDHDWLIAYLTEEAARCHNIINGADRRGSSWQRDADAGGTKYTRAEVTEARRRLAEVEAQLAKLKSDPDAPPSA